MALRISSLALVALVAIASSGSLTKKADSSETVATWYGSELAGNPTASGEKFNPQALTAAHPTLPFGTRLLVCHEGCATVKINDRPDAFTQLDLSEAAAEKIGLRDEGRGEVEVAEEPGPKAPVGKLPDTGAGKR